MDEPSDPKRELNTFWPFLTGILVLAGLTYDGCVTLASGGEPVVVHAVHRVLAIDRPDDVAEAGGAELGDALEPNPRVVGAEHAPPAADTRRSRLPGTGAGHSNPVRQTLPDRTKPVAPTERAGLE